MYTCIRDVEEICDRLIDRRGSLLTGATAKLLSISFAPYWAHFAILRWFSWIERMSCTLTFFILMPTPVCEQCFMSTGVVHFFLLCVVAAGVAWNIHIANSADSYLFFFIEVTTRSCYAYSLFGRTSLFLVLRMRIHQSSLMVIFLIATVTLLS